jgi:pimeloyl-ACP methyl ester carboxylesterase
MYWVTNTAVSSARLLGERAKAKSGFFDPKNVQIPVAVTVFPDEIYAAPRNWAERAYPKLVYFNKLDKGGHFAAWEQPELFVREMRPGFVKMRSL